MSGLRCALCPLFSEPGPGVRVKLLVRTQGNSEDRANTTGEKGPCMDVRKLPGHTWTPGPGGQWIVLGRLLDISDLSPGFRRQGFLVDGEVLW